MGAIIVTWGEPVPGRERQAAKVLEDFRSHLDKLRKGDVIVEWRELYPLTASVAMRSVVQFIQGDTLRLLEASIDRPFKQLLAVGRLCCRELVVDVFEGADDASAQEYATLAEEARTHIAG